MKTTGTNPQTLFGATKANGWQTVPEAKTARARHSENNSATRATSHKQIGVRESPREELSLAQIFM